MQRPYERRRSLPPNRMIDKSYGDFEYVVTQQPQPQICFGSSIARETLPQSGPCLSPFMRRLIPDSDPARGPDTYVDKKRNAFFNVTDRKYSKLGLGPRAPRFTVKHAYQPPLREPPPTPLPKQYCAPFNSTSRRKPLFTCSDYPAACDYWPAYEQRKLKFAYSFGGPKSLICPVQIKCVPYNLDECGVCGCSCSAQGDYWQFENRLFLCRKHYTRLFDHCLTKFRGAKLSEFKPVRDCFFAHAHNSCKAALKIMKSEEILKKLRKEAYLDLYFPLRRYCNQ